MSRMSYIYDMETIINKLFEASEISNLFKKGIYKIHHISKPELCYIGSASRSRSNRSSQKGFYVRFREHLRALEKGNHTSNYLQNVVNKYGIDGIRFEILEVLETTDRNLIFQKEQYYIDTLKPKYNSSKIAKGGVIEYTEERKKAVSVRMKGKALPKYVYDKLKTPVYQFDKQGNFLKKYDSIKAASDKTEIDRASISNAASGKRSSAGGYLWSFDGSVKLSPLPRQIHQLTLQGDFIKTFNSLEEIKKYLNLKSSTAIRNCFIGKQKKAYGFRWIETHPMEATQLGFRKSKTI